jgi:hypothetical protein
LIKCLGRRISKQNARRFFRDCNDSGVGITVHDGRHDGRIDYTQPSSAKNPKIRVDDATDRASGRRMIIRTHLLLNKCGDVGSEAGSVYSL